MDVVLINPQYAPKVIAKHNEHDVDQMVALMSAAAREMQIDLFQRFALMRYWSEQNVFNFDEVPENERTKLAAKVYECIGRTLAEAIRSAAR